VEVNCTALPPELIESELFGHVRGSFTGAISDRQGLISEAHGGTLFLDELGDMPKNMQCKLLRVIETGNFRRLGDNKVFNSDFKVVAATNKNPKEALIPDLFYRIAEAELQIPSLTECGYDNFIELCQHFMPNWTVEMETDFNELWKKITELGTLPGNIRQLKSLCKRYQITKSF